MLIEFMDARNMQTEPYIIGDWKTINFVLAVTMDARAKNSGYPSFNDKVLPHGIERTFADGSKIRMLSDA